ncbi:MAG: Ig-like domain-containing protein [Bacilli bacterium]|nr:Ig-like domain-containing protein [Bacilli bacterium]
MNKFFKLFSGLLCLPLIGGVILTTTSRGALKADAAAETFSTTFSYGDNLVVSNYTDKSSYCLVPKSGDSSVASFETIFNGKSISGNVTVTINNATYGNGTNPSASTFTFYSDAECFNQISATQSGPLPTKSDYVNTVYTIAGTSITGDSLFLKISKPGKQVRLKSVKIEFNYTASSNPFLQFADGAKGIKSVGETASYPATIANATGSEGPITYTSSNESVATVNSEGLVTALAVGTTKITASCDSLTAVSFDMKVYSKNTGLSSNSPLSGEEARDFYNDGVYDSTKSYYVGGYVYKIDGSNYYIDNDSFEFFKCTFNSGLDSSTIAVGTYLVGCGSLTDYKGQVEFNAGTIFVIKNKDATSISITGELLTSSTTIYQNALAEWKYADLVVNAIYDDATTADVTTEATWTFDPATPNDIDLGKETQKVVNVEFTAHYNNLVASVTKSITVKKDKATSLSITNQKTEFTIGEYFSIGTGTIKVNHSSNTSITIGFEDVIVLLGGAEIDVNTYILSASDNGKAVDFKYTENGVTVSLKSKYTITVNSTLTFTGDMSSLLSGKENATVVTELNVDDIVTLSASTTGPNKPQAYGTGTEWRLYQNGGVTNATKLTVSLPEYGYELKSVTITYNVKNKGTLLLASDTTKKVTSGTEIACTGKSISFVVGNTTTDTNGQAQITKVVVKANYDALGTWCDSFLGDLACDPTGRTAPSTDTWFTLGNSFLANLTPEMRSYMANYNTSNSKSVVNRALVKYDYIIEKYNTEASDPYLDFIERIDAGKITLKSNNLFIPMEITSSSFAIITFIALASITAIGGYLVIKRRKEN